jgi:hypothetical protein
MQKGQKAKIKVWETFLAEIEAEADLLIKDILELNEIKNNTGIDFMYFEYCWYTMDLHFWASDMDMKVNNLVRIINILNIKKQNDEAFYKTVIEISKEFDEKAEEIFINWLKRRYKKIKGEYKNIPAMGYSMCYSGRGRQDIIEFK